LDAKDAVKDAKEAAKEYLKRIIKLTKKLKKEKYKFLGLQNVDEFNETKKEDF
jgi:hypothetical protein